MGGILERPNKDIERAFALAADQDDQHKILASGLGDLATLITNLAEELDIPIHRDSELATLLAGVSPQEALPPEAAKLVSEVLVFLHHCDRLAKPS